MPDVRKILEDSGVKVDSLDRIRLSRGVVGKTSYVAGAALLVLFTVAVRASDALLIFVLGSTAAIFLFYLIGILWFASKNPGVALLEGAELIKWRQMEIGMKGKPRLPNSKNIEPVALLNRPNDDE